MKEKRKRGHQMEMGTGLGISFGIILGIILFPDNIALGIPIGLALGSGIGYMMDAQSEKKKNDFVDDNESDRGMYLDALQTEHSADGAHHLERKNINQYRRQGE